ncbi:sigma-70 family RNA polymerase sigma factor [Aquibacillus sp. 3ASR75-11]|uniref:Sigma-70 family RNA polymerase sigma factor n=1 Tax=Terrihalobacillus insolitus TaxID=2950438 RepID=A0A9X3WUU3_9BACI|nr:sigma-70 family RNA polymerase sigma factor [Terrihalobacillus insolitus]MDC3415098.1 sigma-70 family RNA polymerase sigma factor [Terrihalobacillus insolitus]MDC3426095.1 sigma-70 family RNA polymerase sigma factor [Terrihalobacillus insolitus]
MKRTMKENEIKWIQQNDTETVIETLMDEYGTPLTKLAFSYTRDWARAEDIVQDVFITCFHKITTFRGDSTIKTWLYRITVNRCKDSLKTWSIRNIDVGLRHAAYYKDNPEPTPEEAVIRSSDNQILANCVMELPTKYLEVIVLYYYSGLKIEEVAQTLHKNAKTIRTRLRRGRKLLRDLYEEAN